MKRPAAILASAVMLAVFFCCPVFSLELSKVESAISAEMLETDPSLLDQDFDVKVISYDKAALKGIPVNADIKVEIPQNKRMHGKINVPVEFYLSGDLLRRMDLKVYSAVRKSVAVAAVKLAKGKKITAQDVRTEKRDLSRLPSSVISDLSLAVGKESATFVPAGTVLLEWMVRDIPVARKGEMMYVSISMQDVRIKTKGALSEDAYLGKIVKLINKDSGKIITGKVITQNEVEVQ